MSNTTPQTKFVVAGVAGFGTTGYRAAAPAAGIRRPH
jgi:hypothetical protein